MARYIMAILSGVCGIPNSVILIPPRPLLFVPLPTTLILFCFVFAFVYYLLDFPPLRFPSTVSFFSAFVGPIFFFFRLIDCIAFVTAMLSPFLHDFCF